MKQHRTQYECNIHSISNFKIKHPCPEAYNFPAGPSHESPCMSPYWRSQPIRQGKIRDEIEHEEKPEESDD